MKNLMHTVVALGAFTVMLALAMPVSVAAPPTAPGKAPLTAPGKNKLQCFDGTTDGGFGGTCTLNSSGAKGSATLNLSSGDLAGDYAGVYTLESKLYDSLLTDITQVSYLYTGTIAPLPGNLSYNIPIDTNGDGVTNFYAFVDAFYCPGVDGVVDIINDPACGIYEGGVTFHANWAAFLAANPGAKVAPDNYVFIVAERTPAELYAIWTVNNVKFGKAGK
ncbi:MAG: hypothetical protein OEM95_12280 [Gammaproteobacteria bacterium]|nr:hypothetical protein [Gammaproteobacteria bacterium]